MKLLSILLALFLIGCAKPQNASQSEPFDSSCPVWTGLRAPNWLILQLDLNAEMATDVHQCLDGCGSAYFNGHLYQGCDQ